LVVGAAGNPRLAVGNPVPAADNHPVVAVGSWAVVPSRKPP